MIIRINQMLGKWIERRKREPAHWFWEGMTLSVCGSLEANHRSHSLPSLLLFYVPGWLLELDGKWKLFLFFFFFFSFFFCSCFSSSFLFIPVPPPPPFPTSAIPSYLYRQQTSVNWDQQCYFLWISCGKKGAISKFNTKEFECSQKRPVWEVIETEWLWRRRSRRLRPWGLQRQLGDM